MAKSLVTLIKILFLLEVFQFCNCSFNLKWAKKIKDEIHPTYFNPDQPIKNKIDERTGSNKFLLTRITSADGVHSEDDALSKKFLNKNKGFHNFKLNEEALIRSATAHNHGSFASAKFVTKTLPNFDSEENQFALLSKNKKIYQRQFTNNPSLIQTQPKNDDASYKTDHFLLNFAQPHLDKTSLKLSNLKTLALDEKQKTSFSDFTSAIEGYELKEVNQKDIKDLSQINPEDLYAPFSSSYKKHQVPSTSSKLNFNSHFPHSTNYNIDSFRTKNYDLNKKGVAEASFLVSFYNEPQKNYLHSSNLLQNDFDNSKPNYKSHSSVNYPGVSQSISGSQKQSNSDFTSYISPYEQKNNFGTLVRSYYEKSESPSYISHVKHLPPTSSMQSKQELKYNDKSFDYNQNYIHSGAGSNLASNSNSYSDSNLDSTLSHSANSNFNSNNYAQLPAKFSPLQIKSQANVNFQNSQDYGFNSMLIASSSTGDQQSYLNAPVIYGSSNLKQPLANDRFVENLYLNNQQTNLVYNQNNSVPYLPDSSFKNSSNGHDERNNDSWNRFQSYDNDLSYNNENEKAALGFGARKQSNVASSFLSLNDSQPFFVQKYYLPINCLKKIYYSNKPFSIYTSNQGQENSKYSEKSDNYPSINLSISGEKESITNNYHSFNSDDLDSSKLDFKIIHLPISVFKKILGDEKFKLDNY